MSSLDHDSILGELAVKLCGIRDTRQRSFALVSRLRDLQDDEILWVLRQVRERALLGQEDYLLLYNGLMVSGSFSEVLGAGRLSDLVGSLQTRCEYELVAILMDVPPECQDELPFQPFLDVTLKETPLGMRKALARKPDAALIKRIARDQDHRVIRNLLDNSRLTETDVIKIGSTRPTSHRVLETIYNHSRWICRYSIKKVIVLNPYAPLSMAMRLLTFMKQQDLEEVLRSPGLNAVLHGEARRILEKKPARQEDEYSLDL
ncbi:MAG: hypothetical protein HY912_18060 [Desulfomonile tiedjei]|uniref:Uncharacterized protein n=1 Tax=Desulfomonile tiedjei TaxID=2358 RepID=A0A9D6V7I5_9BACT|nr:hypothetical protein [Desulfomonile tiedjei]